MYVQLRVCPYRDPHANHEPLAVQEFDDDGIWVDGWDEPFSSPLSVFLFLPPLITIPPRQRIAFHGAISALLRARTSGFE